MPDECLELQDALLVPPFRSRIKGRIIPLAVLNADGRAIPQAACHTDTLSSARYQPEHSPEATESLSGRWLFGGIISHHFGHQITRSIGRLPWLREAGPVDGIVFSKFRNNSVKRSNINMLHELLAILGVDLPVHIAREPTRIESLFVGEDLFTEKNLGIPDPRFVSWVRNALKPESIPSTPGRKIYVSRTKLDAMHGRILCEEFLETNLRRSGFEIYVPEQDPLPRQIATYAAAEVIVTSDGSPCHVIALTRKPRQKVVVLARRTEQPRILLNHLEGFGEGLNSSHFSYWNFVQTEWWRPVRTANASLVEIDFDGVRSMLIDQEIISSTEGDLWTIPDEVAVQASKAAYTVKGTELVQERKRDRIDDKTGVMNIPKKAQQELKPVPAMDGLRYMQMLKRMHVILKPSWYLEIGTFKGRSLSQANCNFVAIDPAFQLNTPIRMAQAKSMHMFQTTSDEYFSDGFAKRNGIQYDLAFLDGLHHFEALLRDFINAEREMSPNGVIAMHDCCPQSVEMTSRNHTGAAWTGDVWKTLLILLRERPDLDISVANAQPTGLVVISQLDPLNQKLGDDYENLVREFESRDIEAFEGGLAGYYESFELKSPEEVLKRLRNS